MRIISWNVNGLRACAKKGFSEFLSSAEADIVAVQEVRAFADQLHGTHGQVRSSTTALTSATVAAALTAARNTWLLSFQWV